MVVAAAMLLVAGSGCGMVAYQQNSEGVRLFQQAYYQEAIDRFQQAIMNDPNGPDGYYNLAAAYQQLGKTYNRPTDLQQAESLYHQALDRDPNYKDAYRGLAVLLADAGRKDESFKLLEGWSQRNPALADARIELARLHEEYGDKDKAVSKLVEALAVAPDNSRALAALGRLREQAGDTSQALANYSRVLQRDPSQPEIAARVASLQNAIYGSSAPASAPYGVASAAPPASSGLPPLSPVNPNRTVPPSTTTWR